MYEPEFLAPGQKSDKTGDVAMSFRKVRLNSLESGAGMWVCLLVDQRQTTGLRSRGQDARGLAAQAAVFGAGQIHPSAVLNPGRWHLAVNLIG